jgi:hypothetical protein
VRRDAEANPQQHPAGHRDPARKVGLMMETHDCPGSVSYALGMRRTARALVYHPDRYARGTVRPTTACSAR